MAALGDEFTLSAEHHGYRHLRHAPTHARTFRWQQSGRLTIADEVAANAPVESVARLHLHPDAEATIEGSRCRLRFPGGKRGWEQAALERTVYCPAFGVERPDLCLAPSAKVAKLAGSIRIEATR